MVVPSLSFKVSMLVCQILQLVQPKKGYLLKLKHIQHKQ